MVTQSVVGSQREIAGISREVATAQPLERDDWRVNAEGHAQYHFYALLSRLKYIERWALMRSSTPENLAEHSLEVAMIAHALCVLGNVRYGRSLNAERAALIGMYHDASEIITGDMPTPVKYFNPQIRAAYGQVEAAAAERLLDALPEDLRPVYEEVLGEGANGEDGPSYERRLVKAADKISALIKCVDEAHAGNAEFETAAQSTREALDAMADELPEVADFMAEFLPSYGRTLDELLG
ncbi:MAG: 5'-deoxynucleotidase [Atopobiaceae bacterium]|nr:5'-deoxynucleotidase [Atopobiaceae bacterium]